MTSTANSPRNFSLIIVTSILLFIGLTFISLSSISEALYTSGDKLFFIKKQLLWSVIGIGAFIFALKINLKFLKNNATFFFWGSIGLLILTLIPKFSNQALGARRWLDIGFIGIQPSEIMKLSAIIFFSKLFSQDTTRTLKNLIIYLGIPAILIVVEPNLSTTILITAIVLTIYYLSGGEIISLFATCAIGVAISIILVVSSPYRLARLSTSYHSNQMILALASGHWTGKGFANSEQKYRYLPKISTDSILAVIGEETGFIGLCFIIYLYTYLIGLIIKIGQNSQDIFNSLLALSIACWIGYQSLINISAVVALIPLTGVPLPLISYGGSSLVTLLFALGLVQNILNLNLNLLYSSHKSENNKNHRHYRNSSHPRHRINSAT